MRPAPPRSAGRCPEHTREHLSAESFRGLDFKVAPVEKLRVSFRGFDYPTYPFPKPLLSLARTNCAASNLVTAPSPLRSRALFCSYAALGRANRMASLEAPTAFGQRIAM